MRPPREVWLLRLAQVVAERGTCLRRAVGCVLVDQHGHLLATGYNGRAAGLPHCSEGHPCPGAVSPSGTDLDACEAIHAEQNALLQCHDVQAITGCYVTTAPCVTCVKLLLNTSCRAICFLTPYSQPAAEAIWRAAGRTWQRVHWVSR